MPGPAFKSVLNCFNTFESYVNLTPVLHTLLFISKYIFMFNTSQNNNYIFVCQTLSQSPNWGTKGHKFKTVLINSSQKNHITIHFYRRFFPKKCQILLLALPSSFTCIKIEIFNLLYLQKKCNKNQLLYTCMVCY